MNKLIAKYVEAYHQELASSTDKIKKVLMHHVHTWDLLNTDSLIADLIDDTNITADDIVDFLAETYESEGGNEEFHHAVRALQICLRKERLAEHHVEEEIEIQEEQESYEHESLGFKTHEILNIIKY